jgi:hypothetical protein
MRVNTIRDISWASISVREVRDGLENLDGRISSRAPFGANGHTVQLEQGGEIGEPMLSLFGSSFGPPAAKPGFACTPYIISNRCQSLLKLTLLGGSLKGPQILNSRLEASPNSGLRVLTTFPGVTGPLNDPNIPICLFSGTLLAGAISRPSYAPRCSSLLAAIPLPSKEANSRAEDFMISDKRKG